MFSLHRNLENKTTVTTTTTTTTTTGKQKLQQERKDGRDIGALPHPLHRRAGQWWVPQFAYFFLFLIRIFIKLIYINNQ